MPSSSTLSRKIDKPASEILEEPFVRVPYELMRRNHRAAQRMVEREFTAASASLKKELSHASQHGLRKGASKSREMEMSVLEEDREARKMKVLETLRAGSEKIQSLKRKLESIQPSSSNPTSTNITSSTKSTTASSCSVTPPLRSRIHVLEQLDKFDSITDSTSSWKAWTACRTDRFVVEYLLRSGKMDTAEAYTRERGIENLVDVGLFTECARIEKALVEKESCTEALAWCGENRGTLKKTKNCLEFSLRMQEYIELCRKRKTTAALAYMKKFISPWAETHLAQVQQAVVLLAFGEGTGVNTYRACYDRARWELLRREFRDTFLTLYGIPSQPLLNLTTSAGLSTLKLAACFPSLPHPSSSETVGVSVSSSPNAPTSGSSSTLDPASSASASNLMSDDSRIPSLAASPPIHNLERPIIDPSMSMMMDPTPIHGHPEHPQRNVDCPTCGNEMSILAKDVPLSHHVNSNIVCRISGEVMDDENYPMTFPNGYVYSYKALLAMAKDHPAELVTCPRTGKQCPFNQLRKVYIS